MKHISLLFCSILIFSCQGEKKCDFKPEPILKKNWKGILKHEFTPEGTKSIERAVFENGVFLEIFQEVCHYSSQEFHFNFPGTEEMKNQPEPFWIAEAMKQFYYIASLDPDSKAIEVYANFIKQDAHLLHLGEKFETQDGNTITIDRIIGSNEMKLVIKFT